MFLSLLLTAHKHCPESPTSAPMLLTGMKEGVWKNSDSKLLHLNWKDRPCLCHWLLLPPEKQWQCRRLKHLFAFHVHSPSPSLQKVLVWHFLEGKPGLLGTKGSNTGGDSVKMFVPRDQSHSGVPCHRETHPEIPSSGSAPHP